MARLLSVNVGLPRDVPWRDKVVHTGVWKQSVSEPRMARRLNIDGDGQGDLGGHGGEQRAVLVYQIESYRHWQQHLERAEFPYGQFGENFTVEGLADATVCIGDRYRIGAALFEVTQPRVTCYRVGLRLDEPRMAALMVAHGRPGFYMRVLVEGLVQAGDTVVKIADGAERMSIAEIDALLYSGSHPTDALQRALRIEALSPGWRGSLQALLEQAQSGRAGGNPGLSAAASAPAPAWRGFRELRVVRIERESSAVASLYLAEDGGAPLPAAAPGQFISLRLQPDGAPPLIRNYSLSGQPGAPLYRISVKREPGGAGSGYIHTRVQVGDRIECAAPRGTFILDSGAAPVVLLSAGIGATPMLAMLHALAGAHSTRPVWWLHGARNAAEHSFALESRALLAQLTNARSHVCYSRPAAGDQLGRDYTSVGRLSADLLRELAVPTDADVYLCGPASFLQELSAAVQSHGFATDRVHSEVFGAGAALTPGIAAAPLAPHQPEGEPGSGPAVAFARSGLRVAWDAKYGSLLELAEACGVPTRWSCRTGVCHTCESNALSGAVRYQPDPIDAPPPDTVLICCAQPLDDLVLDL